MTLSTPVLFIIGVLFTFLTGCQQKDIHRIELLPTPSEGIEETYSETPTDSLSLALFNGVMAFAMENQLNKQPLGTVIQYVGEWFMESPYVAGSLDENTTEQLVIKLNGFDCVTFVESTLALARMIVEERTDFEAYRENLVEQRYRESKVNGYCSRLHYFSEWILRNEEKGIVQDVSREIGGVHLDKTLNFMSTHRESYSQLATNDSMLTELVQVESDLAGLDIFYVPQQDIKNVYDLLEKGDIIALATDIQGLDVVHTGFVHKSDEGQTGLLHASTTKGVTVSPDLQQYVENNKRQIGILVARPKA